jgi:hypothetical protein
VITGSSIVNYVYCSWQESDQPDLDWKPSELQPDLNNADSDEEFDKLLHRELESDYWLTQFSTCTSKIQVAAVVDKVFKWCERQIDNKKTLMSFAHAKAAPPVNNMGEAPVVLARAFETFVFKLLQDCDMEVGLHLLQLHLLMICLNAAVLLLVGYVLASIY